MISVLGVSCRRKLLLLQLLLPLRRLWHPRPKRKSPPPRLLHLRTTPKKTFLSDTT